MCWIFLLDTQQMPFAYRNVQSVKLQEQAQHWTQNLRCSLWEKLLTTRKRAWTVLMPDAGNSIKQCSQTVILLLKGSWGRWWCLLEVLVYLPGQTKGAGFSFHLPYQLDLNKASHRSLNIIFFLVLLARARTLQLLTIRSQIFQFKYRNNVEDKIFK